MPLSQCCFTLNTLAETEAFGNRLGELAVAGDVICLDGDLGAGKTALTQAIARGLGVPVDCYVTSPSFSILHEYHGRLPLYHFDFYRLGGSNDVEDLGFEEFFYLSGCTVIEWSTRSADILPTHRLSLDLAITAAAARRVQCRFDEERWQHRLSQALAAVQSCRQW